MNKSFLVGSDHHLEDLLPWWYLNVKKYNEFQTISFPVGACTFSSTEIIKKIGFIDESDLFFLMLDFENQF